jgi:hypothetical protein
MAMDPLSYTGGALGKLGGGRLGEAAGERMSGIAHHLGLGYPGGAANVRGPLEEAMKTGGSSTAMKALLELPEETLAKIGSEVAPGSVAGRGGLESVPFYTPTGGMTKATLPHTSVNWSTPAPDIPGVLQPVRRSYPAPMLQPGELGPPNPYAGTFVTHEPRLIPITSLDPAARRAAQEEVLRTYGPHVMDPGDIVHPADVALGNATADEIGLPHARNIGIDPQTGKPMLWDPGGLIPKEGATWRENPTIEPTWLEKKLLGPGLQADLRRHVEEQTARDVEAFGSGFHGGTTVPQGPGPGGGGGGGLPDIQAPFGAEGSTARRAGLGPEQELPPGLQRALSAQEEFWRQARQAETPLGAALGETPPPGLQHPLSQLSPMEEAAHAQSRAAQAEAEKRYLQSMREHFKGTAETPSNLQSRIEEFERGGPVSRDTDETPLTRGIRGQYEEPIGPKPPSAQETKVSPVEYERRGKRRGEPIETWPGGERMVPEKVDALVQKAQEAKARGPGGSDELLKELEGAEQPELRQALKALTGRKYTAQKYDDLYNLFYNYVHGGRQRPGRLLG